MFNKTQKCILFFLIILLLFSIFSIRPRADYDCDMLNEVMEWVEFIYGGESFAQPIANLTLSDGANMWKNGMKGIYNAVQTIGYLMILLYFLIDLMEKSTSSQFSLEQFFKGFLKLVVAVAIISRGADLVQYILEFGNEFLSDVSKAGTTNGLGKESAIISDWKSKCYTADKALIPQVAAIGFMASLLIPWVCMTAIKVVIWVVAVSRAIELSLRCAFLPIGCANIFGEGMRGAGFRYLKKTVAVAIQGGIIIGILVLYKYLTNSLTGVDATLMPIISGFSAIMLIIKSQTFANDIMGV